MARRTRPTLSERIAQVLALDPSAPALEFERRWYSWGDLGGDGRCDRAARRAGRAGRGPVAQPPAAGRPAARSAARRRVRRHREPRARRERVRADLESLGVGTIAGEATTSTRSRRRRAGSSSDTLGAVDVTGDAPAEPDRVATGCRGRDAHERHDRSAEAGAAHLRDASRACSSAPSTTNATPDADLRLRVRCHHRQLAAGPPRRPVPHPAVRERRPLVLPAGAVPGRRVGRRRAPAPARARSASCPAALRMVLDADLDPADLASVRSVISGTAPLAPDDADAFREKYGVPVLISYAATEFGGGVAGLEPRRPRAVLGGEAGQRRARAPGLRAARRRSRHGRAARSRRGGPARGEGAADSATTRAGRARPTSPASTPTASCGSSGAPTRRSSAAGSRSGPKTCAPRSNATRACAAPPSSAGPTRASARCRSRPSSCAPVRRPVTADELLAEAAKVLARYELPDELKLVDALPRTPSGKVDLAAVRELFDGESRSMTRARGRSASSRCPQALAVAPLLRRVAGLVQALEHDDPAVGAAHRRPAGRRARAREPGARRSATADRRRRARRRGGRTSTTRATSAPTTRASPSTRSPSTGRTRRARSRSRSCSKARPASCTAVCSRRSSTASSSTTTAMSASRARRRRCCSSTGGRRRSACRCAFEIDRATDERRITSRARLFLGRRNAVHRHDGSVAGDRSPLAAGLAAADRTT